MLEHTIELKNIAHGLRVNGQRRNEGMLGDCLNLHSDASGKLRSYAPVLSPIPHEAFVPKTYSVPILFNASDFDNGATVTKDSLAKLLISKSFNWSGSKFVTDSVYPIITTVDSTKYCNIGHTGGTHRQVSYENYSDISLTGDFTIEFFARLQLYGSLSLFQLSGDGLEAAGLYGSVWFPYTGSQYIGSAWDGLFSGAGYFALRRASGVITSSVNGVVFNNSVTNSSTIVLSLRVGSVAEDVSYPRAIVDNLIQSWRVTVGLARDISIIPSLPLLAD